MMQAHEYLLCHMGITQAWGIIDKIHKHLGAAASGKSPFIYSYKDDAKRIMIKVAFCNEALHPEE